MAAVTMMVPLAGTPQEQLLQRGRRSMAAVTHDLAPHLLDAQLAASTGPPLDGGGDPDVIHTPKAVTVRAVAIKRKAATWG